MRIALLEDEIDQAERVANLLRGVGHQVHVHHLGRTLLRELGTETFDLILLDWEIPDVSGYEVLRVIRQQMNLTTPVLFLTHRDSEDDVVQALQAGADDFMIKPLRDRELMARVDVVGRRGRDSSLQDEVLELPPYRLDMKVRQIFRDGEPIEMTRREFEVAALLLRHIGKVLSRGHILQTVWGHGTVTTTRTVDMHVSRVRKLLGLSPDVGLRLIAIYGYGYRLERCATGPA